MRIDTTEPIEERLSLIEQCLSLPGIARQHAIAIASHNLAWLHFKAAYWTEQHLLSILEADVEDDREAFWAGFLWNPQVPSSAMYRRIKVGLLAAAKDGKLSRQGHVESLAFLLMTGWLSSDRDEGGHWVESSELRDVILHADDTLRTSMLWHFERTLQSNNAGEREMFQGEALEFFDEVWPRQLSVKTPEMTESLCEVLVAHPDGFATLIDVMSPLLTTIHDATGLHFHLRVEVKRLIRSHPERFLRLLHIVLPADIRYWPYGVSDTLDSIAEADGALRNDSRFLELRRRWDAR